MADQYSGLVGAYRFGFRRSRSALFRSYVLVSAALGGFVAVLLLLGVVTWMGSPTGAIGERALLGVVGLLVLVPLSAPVLLVASRHRRGAARPRNDALLALAGYAFVCSLAVALVITDPGAHPAGGAVGVVLAALDRLPRLAGLLPPVVAAALIAVVALVTRPD